MATNPQYPEQKGPQEVRRHADVHGRLQVPPKRSFPWPLLAIIIAAAILAALIAWLPRTPHTGVAPNAAQVPEQPTAAQIQFSGLNMQPAPTGGALYIRGIVHNLGNTDVTGLQVQAGFMGNNGQVVDTQTRPVEGVSGNGNGPLEDFTKTPIRPNQSRPFRVYFERSPAGWNQQLPELKVTTVMATKP